MLKCHLNVTVQYLLRYFNISEQTNLITKIIRYSNWKNAVTS